MGPGYGKMNELTVLQATDGLCTYLVDTFGEDAARERGIVIGYDHRAKGSVLERFASLFKLAASRASRSRTFDLAVTLLVLYGVIDRNSLAGHDHSFAQSGTGQWIQGVLGERCTDYSTSRSRYCGKNRSQSR